MNGSAPSWLVTAIFVPLVGLLLYRRFRSSFGRQRISVPKMAVRFVLLAVVGTLLLATAHGAAGIASALGGLVAGLALSYVGIQHTRLEHTAEGKFYTPNRWIGLVVTALLVGRLTARMFTTYAAFAANAPPPSTPLAGAQQSPITLAIFFLMAGYYGAYYAAVWWKSRALVPAPVAPLIT